MDSLLALWPPETLALTAAAFLAAGLVKGTLGLGLPVVVIAILTTTIGLHSAIGLILLPSIVMNFWQAVVGGHFAELLRRLWSLILMTVVGVWVGVQILAVADVAVLTTLLGIVLILYSLWSLSRAQVRPPGRWEVILSPVVGFLAGGMFGMVGNFMVPGAIYHQALDLGRDRLVQALGMSYVVISVAMLLFMSRFAMIDGATLLVSIAAMVPGIVGMAIGRQLRHFLNETQFRTLFFLGLIVVGGYMLARAWLL